jgi:hypothetical protein
VALESRGGLGWLQGFDEWMVRCGLDSMGSPGEDVVRDNNGNPVPVKLTLHGRIANLPAHYVEIRADPEARVLSIIGHVDESGLFLPGLRLETTISTAPLAARLSIADEIINLKGTPAEFEVLYHANFGPPFLEAGSRLLAPVVEAAPRDPRAAEGVAQMARYLAPTPGYIEQVYFYELAARRGGSETLVGLANAAGDFAASVRFDKGQLPCFTQWKNTVAAGDGYVTGLEPGTNFPNLKRIERDRGRLKTLAPGGRHLAALHFEVHQGRERVRALEDEIRGIQGDARPLIHSAPNQKFS